MTGSPAKSAILGFIAAALSVVLFHQTAVFLLTAAGVIPGKPWATDPYGPLGVPAIVNHMFWGGLWGALFALIWPRLPTSNFTLKGIIFAIFGVLLVGRWILVPLIKGEPLFAGLNPTVMLGQVFIATLFGAGIALIYQMLTRRSAG